MKAFYGALKSADRHFEYLCINYLCDDALFIEALKSKLRNNKTIAKNTGYLTIIECVRIFMPFVALPYIIRTVGMEKYGMVALAQTIVQYFIVVINFGLDISAVKDVSVHRNDKLALNRIVSTVLFIKLILFALFSCVTNRNVSRSVYGAEQNSDAFAFLTCLSELLFPVWYYQGIEKMKYITIVRSSSILFYTCSVFIFIRGESDYPQVALLQSMGNVLAGMISFYCLLRLEGVRLKVPCCAMVWIMFFESVPFWFSRISVIFNTNLAKTVSGIFFTMESVAAFELAQKVSNAVRIPTNMLNQAVYPHIARTQDKRFVARFIWINILFAFVLSTVIFVVSPLLVSLFTGTKMPETISLMRIFCLYTFCTSITICLGSTTLVAFGHPKPFNNSVIYSTFVLVIVYLSLYWMNLFTIYNFALALILADVLFCSTVFITAVYIGF